MKPLHQYFLLLCCIIGHASLHAQFGYDTTVIYFDIGKEALKDVARWQLDSISKVVKQDNRRMLIYGYADYLGTASPNQSLATRRAQKVQGYLMEEKFVPIEYFLQVDGVGQVLKKGKEAHGNQAYRRVDIYIKRAKPPVVVVPPVVVKEIMMESGGASSGINASMATLSINETLTLDNILFYPNVSTIIPSSYAQLNELYSYLAAHPTVKIQLEGHICCTDPYITEGAQYESHLELSTNRARRVCAYLVEKGIDAQRLSYKGFGSTKPKVFPEMSAADQQTNRRVEVRLIAR